MKITKFEHACFAVEYNDQSLIVDPGGWTTDLHVPDNVVGIVITHEHQDHMNKDLLEQILERNPDAIILAHQDITTQLGNFRTQAVVPNEGIKVGSFELEFFGGKHATIFDDLPVITNIGVMINQRLYYPGDSFTVPDRSVEILALPISAPWLKVNEVVNFLTTVKPQLVFPTHDAILSDAGKELLDRMVPPYAEKNGGTYRRLLEPIEA